MANKKPKREVPSSPFDMLSDPKVVMGLAKSLLPIATQIAKGIVAEQTQQTKNPQKKKKTSKKTKKKSKKLDSKHDLCKCGAVKLKTSKYCRVCSDKRRKRK